MENYRSGLLRGVEDGKCFPKLSTNKESGSSESAGIERKKDIFLRKG